MEVPVAQWSEYILPDWRNAGSNPAWTQKRGCGWKGHLVMSCGRWTERRQDMKEGGYPGAPPPGDFQDNDQQRLYILPRCRLIKKYPGSTVSQQDLVFLQWALDNPPLHHNLQSFTPHRAFKSWRSGWDLNQQPLTHEAELIPLSHRFLFSDCAGTYISPVNLHQNRAFTLYK